MEYGLGAGVGELEMDKREQQIVADLTAATADCVVCITDVCEDDCSNRIRMGHRGGDYRAMDVALSSIEALRETARNNIMRKLNNYYEERNALPSVSVGKISGEDMPPLHHLSSDFPSAPPSPSVGLLPNKTEKK